MEQKMKFVVIALIVVIIACLAAGWQLYSSSQSLTGERDKIKKDYDSLMNDFENERQKAKRIETQLAGLNNSLTTVVRERDDLQKKYEATERARQELATKIKAQEAPKFTPVTTPQSTTPDAYWAAVVKAKADLELQLDAIRRELQSTKISNAQIEKDKGALELEMNTLRRDTAGLRQEIIYNQKIADTLSQELVRERNDRFSAVDSLEMIKKENAMLRTQLGSLTTRKINLEVKVQELEDTKAALQRRLDEIQTMLSDKASQIGDLKQKLETIHEVGQEPVQEGQAEAASAATSKKEAVELAPIVVRPQAETSVDIQPPSVAKVLAVNRENNFVIINLGEDVGIKLGDTFQVYRDGKPTAKLEAIQVRKDITACDIKKESTPVAVGDLIK